MCAQVIIGTHGRMKNWVSRRQLDIDDIVILVFDEADEMLKGEAFADDTGVDVRGGARGGKRDKSPWGAGAVGQLGGGGGDVVWCGVVCTPGWGSRV